MAAEGSATDPERPSVVTPGTEFKASQPFWVRGFGKKLPFKSLGLSGECLVFHEFHKNSYGLELSLQDSHSISFYLFEQGSPHS